MATKAKDKYIVSFNSDTSDSEDESDSDVKPLPSKPVASVGKETDAVLMNGHVEAAGKDVVKTTSTASKTGKSSAGTAQVTSDKTTSGKINGDASLLDNSVVKKDLKSERKLGTSRSNNDVSSFDPLASEKPSREPDNNLGTRKGKTYDSNDLDSAYSRAKEKTLLAKTSGKNLESEKSNFLIDFSEASSNSESTISKVGKSEDKTASMRKPAEQKSYTADFEAEMDALFGRNRKTASEAVTNGKPPLNFHDVEVKKHNAEVDDGLDADLLIYASPGTQNIPKSKFDFDVDSKTQNGPKRPFNIDVDETEEKTFRRQTSKHDERESLLSPKEKYRNIDEKFSAICSKYGRETKREIPPEKGELDAEENGDIYGNIRVKTTSRQEAKPVATRNEHDEDLGFSEDRTPRQKLDFDDIVNWKRTSTDDLIQRILADARGDSKAPKSGIAKGREPRDYASDAENRLPKMDPYEKDMGPADRKYDYGQAEPSLLERRLAALGGQEKHEDDAGSYGRPRRQTDVDPYSRPRSAYQDDSEQFYKRKTRGGHVEDIDRYSVESGEGGRYVPWKERQKMAYDDEDDLSCGASARGYQSHLLRPPIRCDGDSESDDDSYRSVREREPVYPDEWFTPTRHEDTAIVVRERTSEVRNMVENQTVVLGRLKKAAESFNDLDAEIRALKQQCIENQVARQAVIEDILTDMREDKMIKDEPQPAPRRYTRGSYKSSSYSSKYNPSYTPSYDYSRSREGSAYRTLDSDQESDRLGGYALGSIAKSKWGEPGGSRAFRSASVSRFDNVEKEHSYDKYGLYNSRRSMRASSHVDDYDARSDYSTGDRVDDVETASVRSVHSDKNTEEDDDSKSGYRSRQTPKYGTYLSPTPSYDTPSYSRPSYSATRESRSPSRRLMTSSTSDLTFERPRTRGMSLPPPEKPFTSRFLSKVREKKAAGVDTSSSRDKPFTSRFLTRSFDSDYHSGSSSRGSLASTPDRNSYSSTSSRTYSSRRKDAEKSRNDGSETATTAAD